MACGAPEAEAPDLLAALEGENNDTYFIRQPDTSAEVEKACCAAEVCCVSAIRYGGTDRDIIRRLGNSPEYCDWVITSSGAIEAAGPWTHPFFTATAPSRRKQWWQFWKA
jgi:hypothetical protein